MEYRIVSPQEKHTNAIITICSTGWRQTVEGKLSEGRGATEQCVPVQEDNHRGIPFYEARGFLFQEKRTQLTETKEEQVSLRYSRQIIQ